MHVLHVGVCAEMAGVGGRDKLSLEAFCLYVCKSLHVCLK